MKRLVLQEKNSALPMVWYSVSVNTQQNPLISLNYYITYLTQTGASPYAPQCRIYRCFPLSVCSMAWTLFPYNCMPIRQTSVNTVSSTGNGKVLCANRESHSFTIVSSDKWRTGKSPHTNDGDPNVAIKNVGWVNKKSAFQSFKRVRPLSLRRTHIRRGPHVSCL